MESCFLMDIVHKRSESDSTVIFSPLTIFDVLINPPNLISVSSENKCKPWLDPCDALRHHSEIGLMCYLLRSHWSPVVVVLADGAPIGMSPQWGPWREGWIRISCRWVFRRSWMRQSSDKRIILVSGNRYKTLWLPASWSNLPPSAPVARIWS